MHTHTQTHLPSTLHHIFVPLLPLPFRSFHVERIGFPNRVNNLQQAVQAVQGVIAAMRLMPANRVKKA